ncbi:MAG: hypothetical protein ACYDHE_16205 [Candidatus Acidiferrales bacterium]
MALWHKRKLRSIDGWAVLLVGVPLAVCLVWCPRTASAQNVTPYTTVVGIKLMKSQRGALTAHATIELPASCPQCAVLHGPYYEGQNAWELFFYVRVPTAEKVIRGIRVDSGGIAIRAVIVEKNSIAFSQDGRFVDFELPVDPRERSSTLELQTNLEWPGLTVRIEHAYIDRRAGPYAKDPWPATERQAALNLEFGLREAIRFLGLDREVYAQQLGTIHLMGFDTNDPLGHEDYPPHIHIILRWPHFAGSQAPHLYLTSSGLLRGNVVTVDGLPDISSTTVSDGTAFPAIDYMGQEAYQTTVERDGTLLIERPGMRKAGCHLRPVENASSTGFAAGVTVHCDGAPIVRVRALDNTELGELQVWVNSDGPEVYRYSPDTSVLISSTPALPTFARESEK